MVFGDTGLRGKLWRMVSVARFELATPSTPRTCATRLRYTEIRLRILPLQLIENCAQLALDGGNVDAGTGNDPQLARCRRLRFFFDLCSTRIVQAVARAADGEAFLVEQLADAPDEQHLVVLVVAAVAAPLHRLELGELLLPIAQDVRLHPAKLAHLNDGEVALRRDRRQLRSLAVWLHGAPFTPSPLAFAKRCRCSSGG